MVTAVPESHVAVKERGCERCKKDTWVTFSRTRQQDVDSRTNFVDWQRNIVVR